MSISVEETSRTILALAERVKAGMSYIAEDRGRTASAGAASAMDNLALGFHRRPPLARPSQTAR